MSAFDFDGSFDMDNSADGDWEQFNDTFDSARSDYSVSSFRSAPAVNFQEEELIHDSEDPAPEADTSMHVTDMERSDYSVSSFRSAPAVNFQEEELIHDSEDPAPEADTSMHVTDMEEYNPGFVTDKEFEVELFSNEHHNKANKTVDLLSFTEPSSSQCDMPYKEEAENAEWMVKLGEMEVRCVKLTDMLSTETAANERLTTKLCDVTDEREILRKQLIVAQMHEVNWQKKSIEAQEELQRLHMLAGPQNSHLSLSEVFIIKDVLYRQLQGTTGDLKEKISQLELTLSTEQQERKTFEENMMTMIDTKHQALKDNENKLQAKNTELVRLSAEITTGSHRMHQKSQEVKQHFFDLLEVLDPIQNECIDLKMKTADQEREIAQMNEELNTIYDIDTENKEKMARQAAEIRSLCDQLEKSRCGTEEERMMNNEIQQELDQSINKVNILSEILKDSEEKSRLDLENSNEEMWLTIENMRNTYEVEESENARRLHEKNCQIVMLKGEILKLSAKLSKYEVKDVEGLSWMTDDTKALKQLIRQFSTNLDEMCKKAYSTKNKAMTARSHNEMIQMEKQCDHIIRLWRMVIGSTTICFDSINTAVENCLNPLPVEQPAQMN